MLMRLFILIILIIAPLHLKAQLQILNNYLEVSPRDSVSICINNTDSVHWQTNNPYFRFSKNSRVYLDKLPPIEFRSGKIFGKQGKSIDSCEITAIDWKTNISTLKIHDILPECKILFQKNGWIYFSINRKLYRTKNGFQSRKFIGRLPGNPSSCPILDTQYGYFLRSGNSIYQSLNLKSWLLCFKGTYDGLYNEFDSYFDSSNKKLYIYFGEYTFDNDNNKHKVYRGIIDENGKSHWEIILAFNSRKSYSHTPEKTPIARHIHLVKVDPYTGTLWVGTGDEDHESGLYYSTNQGKDFNIFGLGKQEFRVLSMWFTKKYIYWNMDSAEPQSIWRIPRSFFELENSSLTPILNQGKTKIGITYFVKKSSRLNYFPVEIGKAYIETEPRVLGTNNSVIPINDSEFDKKELVANLPCGSMWYTISAKTDKNDTITIMGVAPEGNYHDKRNRVFGIKEYPNGSVNVQELLNLPSPEVLENVIPFSQLEPKCQDSNGYIYFSSRDLAENGIYKTKLLWKDSSNHQVHCPEITIIPNYLNKLLIYPNPNSGNFKLLISEGHKFKTSYKFEIYDLAKKIVYSKTTFVQEPKMEYSINVSLKSGLYLVVVRTISAVYTCKLIIEQM